MTAVAASTSLNAFSQLEQFFGAIGGIFGSVQESTDTAFRRVQVQKKDAAGHIRFYPEKGGAIDPATGQVKRISVLTYIEDVKTGEMYLDEAGYVIATKCALIGFALPFYALGKIVWHAAKTPLKISTIAMDAMSKVCKELSECKGCAALGEVWGGLGRSAEVLCTGVFEIVKVPLFAFGCELAAIYGVCKTHHGRKFEAAIEKAWMQGATHKEDFRHVPARPGENCWTAFTKDVADSHPFYLAHCFQVRGNVNDRRITVVGRSPL